MRPPRPLVSFGVLLAVAFAVLATACGSGGDDDQPTSSPTTTAPAASAAFPLSVTDGSGKTVVIQKAPARIISYSPGATETLFAIGAGKTVVAVDQFSDYPAAEVSALPRVEYSRPAPEPAIALNPDLVIFATRQEPQLEGFRAVGLTVLYLKEPTDIKGVIESVRTLGKVTNHVEGADKLASDMEKRVAAVETRMRAVTTGPTVFYEVTPDLRSVSPDSFIGGVLSLAKAQNIAAGATTAFPQISLETIIKANPEVILLGDAGASGGQTLATVKARPGWSAISAVASGRVHELDANLFSRPGPRIVDALESLVKLLHPNLS